MTDAQVYALRWLHDHGGSGLIDKYGRVVAAGEFFPKGPTMTWLRLVAAALIEGMEDHLVLTRKGRQIAEEEAETPCAG